MKNPFANLAWTHKVAFVTLLLGFGALILGDPYKGERVNLNVQELALIVQGESDHVSVQELADWIIQGKADYRLIDVRSGDEFNNYHIPGAEHIEVAELATADILRNEKIVVYSEGGIHAAQAWMLLASRGFKNSYILLGGLEEWKSAILFPQLPENAMESQTDSLAKVKSVCSFFGGTIQASDDTADEPVVAAPKLKLPTTVPAVPKSSSRKKKKEGC